MYEVLKDIVEKVKSQGALDGLELGRLLNEHNKDKAQRVYSKKKILPFYLELKEEGGKPWEALQIDEEVEKDLFKTLRMKPRRSASGVATITVITKPHPCSGDCLYCPNDVRMPKSYLHKEPACQRAERNFFDPYLQVASRLRALTQMGHACDKIELIVLGGSWTDHPPGYQTWFVKELFRALNEADDAAKQLESRKEAYRKAGIDSRDEVIEVKTASMQMRIDEGDAKHNEAVEELYGKGTSWDEVCAWQDASMEDLRIQQEKNETAAHRVVGLVVETRPETLDGPTLARFREFGFTKVQIGVQTLDERILEMNERACDIDALVDAFELLRAYGFKIHAHFMANLYGSDVVSDKEDYRRFMSCSAFMPDEVKIYPCVLVPSARLREKFDAGEWRPYSEDELIDVLSHHMRVTPPYTRISRMIRDISAEDIIAGSKKTNLRQLVEASDRIDMDDVVEMRHREIAGNDFDIGELELEDIEYKTSNTTEHFLQWVLPDGRLAGFLRLSLPDEEYVRAHVDELAEGLGCAMIREVHVYGQAASLHRNDVNAQHMGLGKRAIERAIKIAKDAGHASVNVISAVGTRQYYRNLGFTDGRLYLTKEI